MHVYTLGRLYSWAYHGLQYLKLSWVFMGLVLLDPKQFYSTVDTSKHCFCSPSVTSRWYANYTLFRHRGVERIHNLQETWLEWEYVWRSHIRLTSVQPCIYIHIHIHMFKINTPQHFFLDRNYTISNIKVCCSIWCTFVVFIF